LRESLATATGAKAMGDKITNIALSVVLGIIAIGFGVLTNALLSQPDITPEVIIGWLTGGLLPLLTIIYSQIKKRSIHFFLLSQRIRTFFSLQTLNWSLAASFTGSNISHDIIDDIVNQLMSLNSERVKVNVKRINLYNCLVTIIPGPAIDLTFIPQVNRYGDAPVEANEPSIYLSINNYRIGHRQVTKVLSKEIAPVLEIISHSIHSMDSLYSFTIEFDKNQNPFYSLYVSKIPTNNIAQFLIQLNIYQQGQKSRVVVSDSKISITAKSQAILRDLALQFITFDSSLEEHIRHV
jgi:hypothetical protein